MTLRASVHSCIFPDFSEQVFGGFEDMQIHVGGREILLIGINAFEDSNTVSGVTLTITGGFDIGPAGSFAVPISSITGDMTFTNNVINVVTVTGSPTQSLVVIENPPPVVSLLLEAATWPNPHNGSFVRIGASWR